MPKPDFTLTAGLHRNALAAMQRCGLTALSLLLHQVGGGHLVVVSVHPGDDGPDTTGDPTAWESLICEQYRTAGVYIIPLANAQIEASTPAKECRSRSTEPPREPHTGHLLVVRLVGRTGVELGLFAAIKPQCNPEMLTLAASDLESFADQATEMIERTAIGEQRPSPFATDSPQVAAPESVPSFDATRMFESILRTSMDLVAGEMAALYLLNKQGTHGQLRASIGFPDLESRAQELPLSTGILGSVLASGQAEIEQRYEENSRGLQHLWRLYGVSSYVCAPLCLDDRTVGAVFIGYSAPEHVPSDALETLGTMAAQSALAIRNFELYDHLARYADRLSVIQAIAGRLNRMNDPGSIRLAIVEELRQLVDYEACRIYLCQGDLLIPAALRAEHQEYSDETTTEFIIEVGRGITGWVAQHGEAVLLDDAENDPRGEHVAGSDFIDESMMIVPMKYDERVVGVISLSKLGLRQFTPVDLHMLCTLADQAAVAIENAHLIERLEADAEALRRSEERYQFVARATTDVIWDSDLITGGLTWTGAIESMFGYAVDEVRGGDWWEERIHPAERDRVVQGINASIVRALDVWSDEYRFRRNDGTFATLIDRGYLVKDASGRPTRMIGSMMDISERKALEEQLAHQAFHDSLTGLPNRALFLDRVQHALLRSGRDDGSIAVLFLDLDRFKVVNDSLGHEVGDHLLQAVAARLGECLRPDDTVARLGGDEFTILLEANTSAGEALRISDRLTHSLQKPFRVDGHEVFITTSIGIAIKHSHHEAPADLMRDADLAMYRAKERGRACCEVFDPSMNVRAQRRLALENELRHAVERRELVLEYQPTVSLRTGVVCGVEALVRWRHPVRGLVEPVDFIPLAEETGLILSIGRWIIEEVCRQMREWQDARPWEPPVSVSVNLSARQFANPTLTSEIARALASAEVDPPRLMLEITETVVMEEAEVNITTLRRLKELGVQLAIDDFGTGYSSLSYLKRFPVDTLKIDKSIVNSLGRDAEDGAIVNAVITLAHTLGMQVTAEGVETCDQLSQLSDLGCDLAQGYLFARPMNAAGVSMLPRALPVARTHAV